MFSESLKTKNSDFVIIEFWKKLISYILTISTKFNMLISKVILLQFLINHKDFYFRMLPNAFTWKPWIRFLISFVIIILLNFYWMFFVVVVVVVVVFFLQKIIEIFDIFISIFPTKNFIKNLTRFFSKWVWKYFETKIFVIGKEFEENNFFKVSSLVFINIVNM